MRHWGIGALGMRHWGVGHHASGIGHAQGHHTPRVTRQAEFARTLGGEPALLDAGALRELNRPEGVEAYFGDMPTQVRLTLTLTLTLTLALALA